jgi:hypothetical protein
LKRVNSTKADKEDDKLIEPVKLVRERLEIHLGGGARL